MTDKVQKITQALAEAQLQRNNTAGFIKTWQTELATKDDRIVKLKADLAEAKKPELKSGDIWEDGALVLYLNEWLIKNRGSQKGRIVDCQGDIMPNFDKSYYRGQPIIANLKDILADLKATSEPLEEFEVDECRFKISDRGCVHLDPYIGGASRRIFTPAEFDKLADGVRRMQRTLKAKQ